MGVWCKNFLANTLQSGKLTNTATGNFTDRNGSINSQMEIFSYEHVVFLVLKTTDFADSNRQIHNICENSLP